jgi:hypothetical protein
MDAHVRSLPAALAAAVVALALALPGAASASPSQESIVMDDNLLLYRGDQVAASTLKELKSLGVDRVRVNILWKAIAPSPQQRTKPVSLTDAADPAQYPQGTFGTLDHLLREAKAQGIEVLVDVTGPAPLWATGRPRGKVVNDVYDPDPVAFGKFVEMLGRRYDGSRTDDDQGQASLPRIDTWGIWNEPNQAGWLQPQWVRTPAANGRAARWTPYAPKLYRALARAAIAGLRRSGHGGDTVLLGETAPQGVDRRNATGSLRPGLFLRTMLCLDSRLRPMSAPSYRANGCDFAIKGPLAVTGYAHHPYPVKQPPTEADPVKDDMTLADRDRLIGLLDAAGAAKRLPAGLPVWYTEFGYQTQPPDPIRGVSLADQARWLAEADYITWRDPRVVAQTQFLLRDDDPRSQYPPDDPRYWSTYQTGLLFADGSKKPAYDSYRLPIYVPTSIPAGGQVTVWGRVRPAAGTAQSVQLQFAPSGSVDFSDVGDPVETDAHGYFQASMMPSGSGTWRFRWSPAHDPGLLPEIPPDVLPPGVTVPALPPPVGPEPAPIYFSAPASVQVG